MASSTGEEAAGYGKILDRVDDILLAELADASAKMLSDAEPAVRDQAASEWCAWEDAHVSLTPVPNPRFQDTEFRLRTMSVAHW